MYTLPRTYVCKSCGYETEWSRDVPISSPLMALATEAAPVCPLCWNKWLLENFVAMERKKV